MKDAQIIEFMRENAAEIQVRADKGSPICSTLLKYWHRMNDADSAEEGNQNRYLLEEAIKEFQDFKVKGWL